MQCIAGKFLNAAVCFRGTAPELNISGINDLTGNYAAGNNKFIYIIQIAVNFSAGNRDLTGVRNIPVDPAAGKFYCFCKNIPLITGDLPASDRQLICGDPVKMLCIFSADRNIGIGTVDFSENHSIAQIDTACGGAGNACYRGHCRIERDFLTVVYIKCCIAYIGTFLDVELHLFGRIFRIAKTEYFPIDLAVFCIDHAVIEVILNIETVMCGKVGCIVVVNDVKSGIFFA